jgi:2-polyprenyl-6-methoxyphenol hydroxylase-like FAD-dependent oxidoreductase
MLAQSASGVMTRVTTRCCIAGGGPAGMMAGLLLARAGVDTIVLEKHRDFLRDFRGDTVHPSTLELMHELGVLEDFLKRPHQEVRQIGGDIDGNHVTVADFTHLPTRCKFVALMPQWEFLDFLADEARRYPTFRLFMNADVVGLRKSGGTITGVEVRTPDGDMAVDATLTVGADGRRSLVRERAGLAVRTLGAPIDVLWMRVSRRDTDRAETLGVIRSGRVFVMLNRGDYWQCAFVIPKGAFDELRGRGLEAFREDIASMSPFLSDRVGELRMWDDVKLLTVIVDRLQRWYAPGLLCIGDAAHAMSPIGGVGINLAVQDAVAAANLLYQPLRDGIVSPENLAAVERRRLLPTRLTQAAQVAIQRHVLAPVIGGRRGERIALPFPVRMLRRYPILRRIPARLVGIGIRPEHIRTPDAFAASGSAGYN